MSLISTRSQSTTLTTVTNNTDSFNSAKTATKVLSDVGNTTISLPPQSTIEKNFPIIALGGLLAFGLILVVVGAKGGK